MNHDTYRAKTYLKSGCPFSFKFLLFMTEAKLLDQIEMVVCPPEGEAMEQLRVQLEQATGANATFPTVEVEPGVYRSDSDQLIDYYAQRHGIDVGGLQVLPFYKDGLFQDFIRLYMENRDLKAKQGE